MLTTPHAAKPNGIMLNARPLYLQVKDNLAERIAGREWGIGIRLPNEGDLARTYGVSPGTMRKALDALEGEGAVTRRQGHGTFVNDRMAIDEARMRGCRTMAEAIIKDSRDEAALKKRIARALFDAGADYVG